MSGTGENPVRYGDPAAERTYSAWLDHLAQRTDVDGSRPDVWRFIEEVRERDLEASYDDYR